MRRWSLLVLALFASDCARRADVTAPAPAAGSDDAGSASGEAGEDALVDALVATTDPPVPPIACRRTPWLHSARDVGAVTSNATLVALDERRVAGVWASADRAMRGAVFDAVTQEMSEVTELWPRPSESTWGSALGPGMAWFLLRADGTSQPTTRIYASGRWSPPFDGYEAIAGEDGNVLLVGANDDRIYDPPWGGVGPPIEKPFVGQDELLSGDRVLSFGATGTRPATTLHVGLYDGARWQITTLAGYDAAIHAGDDVVAFVSTSSRTVSGTLRARRLRLDDFDGGFGPEVVVSATPQGDGVIGEYGSGAALYAESGAVRFAGAVASCDGCAPTVVERVLGPDGWSAPQDLGFGASAVLGDVTLQRSSAFSQPLLVFRDRARAHSMVRVRGAWIGFDVVPTSPASDWGITPAEGGLFIDAMAGAYASGHRLGWLDLRAPAAPMSWIDLPTSFSDYTRFGVIPYTLASPDVGGGIVAVPSTTVSETLVRVAPGPAITSFRSLAETQSWSPLSLCAHAGLVATAGAGRLRIDAWNDVGMSDPLEWVTGTTYGPSVAALRCGGVVSHFGADGHLWVMIFGGE